MLRNYLNYARLMKDFLGTLAQNRPTQYGSTLNSADAYFALRLLINRNPVDQNELSKILDKDKTFREFLNELIDSEEFSHHSGFLPAGRRWMANVEGFRLWFDTGDREMGVRMALGNYEPLSVQIVREHVSKGDKCIDAGANIGFFTCLMASIVGSSGFVHAFEPMPQCYEILEMNISENVFQDRVNLYRIACSDHNEVIKGSVASRMYIASELNGCQTVEMQSERIDSLVHEKIDFVKIDVEGYEPQAIRGMAGIIEKSKPIILSEISQYWLSKCSGIDGNSFLGMLIDLGYEVFLLEDRSQPLARNSLALGELDNFEVIALPVR